MTDKKDSKTISFRVPIDKAAMLKKELKECRDYILGFPEDHEIVLFHLPRNEIDAAMKDLVLYLKKKGHDININRLFKKQKVNKNRGQ